MPHRLYNKIYIYLILVTLFSTFSNNLLAIDPPEELIIIDIKEGNGRIAKNGKEVAVHYEGWLFDPNIQLNNNNPDINTESNNYCDAKGRSFDSSIMRGVPFSFFIGSGTVIKGWESGIVGMSEDGRRCLVIPPHMAYGNRSVGGGLIPANSTLIFEIILLGVR